MIGRSPAWDNPVMPFLDWARQAGNREMEELLVSRTRTLYAADRDCPLGYEPSGQDFLSPCLAEADLMRRVLAPAQFAVWLETVLPRISRNTVVRAPGVIHVGDRATII